MASVFSPFLSVCLSLLLPLVVAQSTESNIRVGTTIAAIDSAKPWISPSNEFAFGFYQLENKELFLLAIWYYKIPSRTIVWYANGDNPVPRRSKVELTSDRGLVLSDPNDQVIWKSDFATGEVAYAGMNDTGNFVVYGTVSQRLWESFGNPTDTLLPTQVMSRKSLLSSRHKENNFSKGRFQFRLLEDGNAVLNTINLQSNFAYVAYYISGTRDAENSSNSGYQVKVDQDGSFYILRNNNQRYLLSLEDLDPSADYYYRVTLNFDGVLTLSNYPKNFTGISENWTVVKTIPDNICTTDFQDMGSGTCGFNSICTLKADKRPTCKCPPRYSLSDANDEYGNCQADFMQGCEADAHNYTEDLYDLVEMQNTDWPTSDYELIAPCSSLKDCKTYCLQDCLCIVAVFNENGCWKKSLPLPYGRQDRQVNSISILKVRKPEFAFKNPPMPFSYVKKNKNSLIILISVLLGSSVFVNLALVGILCMGSFLLYHKKITRNHINENGIQSSLRYFRYEELEEATDGFKEELGRGSFGIVYKGVIKTDSQDPIGVAVKKLDRVVQDKDNEFRTEVRAIAQKHHKNLVKLLGYCDEGQHRMLVYECLSNGTLASFLFGDLKPSWSRRTQIALEIARGLFYLHEECSPQIIHCDIKPQNILLDDYYVARISDFGLSKLLGINQSYTNTAIRGTKGYVAPEWFKTVPVTVKVDVYSFGVLLLEIICCRRNVAMDNDAVQKAILTDWACDCFLEGTLDALVDNDAEALSNKMKLERFVMVAIWCIQEDFSLRPTIKEVILMLEGIIQVPAPPCPCPLIN
ncbi:G-type lectin S-receptor-like serine/threonine-protein kinase LECRK3 [Durio zibethinus]|uniref:Receptor-like serine/threonine-protein kinase n=1 Tax=Durio zibethinus TaxID=66656 RepID=A0A6P5ZUR5_DURZI|nr:G-type lectin S-receptor-like serine/threonine-protein kinase LECRK3 [Durio zibethinus]